MNTRRFLAAVGLSAAMFLPSVLRAEPDGSVPATAPASQPQEIRGNRENPLRVALEQLELTDAQKARLRSVFQSERTKLQALRDDTSMTRDAKRAKMAEIREEARAEIEAILTPEQREQIRERMSRRRENWGDRRQQGPPPAPRRS